MDLNRLVADAILAAADAVVATGREGIIRVWNSGAERIFGHRADEALGQSLDLIIPERRHRQLSELKAKRLTGAADQKPTATPVTSAQAVKARARDSRLSAALEVERRRKRFPT